MRLLDLIAQARTPLLVEHGVPAQVWRLQAALDLAPQVLACPLRYVLTDELAFLCAELAYCSGDRLARCLDLVRFPASQLWIEWAERPALEGTAGFFGAAAAAEAEPGRRVGILLRSAQNGTQAVLHAVWSDQEQAIACPMEAVIDLRGVGFRAPAAESPYREWISVTETVPALAQLLDCARFRFESSWAAYYARVADSRELGASLVRDGLAGIARDVPMVMAFLLLLASREGVALRPVSWEALNYKRARAGRAPLLNHVEAALALQCQAAAQPPRSECRGRFGPRRHHVRGHLVRRHNRVFWRRPHFRGNEFQGSVLTRTVRLSFERRAARAAAAPAP